MKTPFLILAFFLASTFSFSQILTSSPYSRYGFGELNSQTFATSSAMGGSFIAYYQDTIAPFNINIANPAGLASLRLSTFELGGQAQFTRISSDAKSIKKKNMNFSYGTVGFPLKRFGGMAFGIMPYSTVGYKITSTQEVANIGTMKYVFQGDGGFNKAFLGAGVKPFRKREFKFIHSALYDSLYANGESTKIKRKKFGKQLLSELSIGATGNYIFGTTNQTTDVIYPGSITYFNTKRQRSVQVSDFTFNGGIQTHFTIDSVKYHGKDSLKRGHRIARKQKLMIGAGFFFNAPMGLRAKQNNIIYNYALDGFGIENPKDTVLNSQGNNGTIVIPMEMGFGVSIKKGERLTLLMDAATTNWSGFKYFEGSTTEFTNSYRVSAGLNYCSNKTIRGFSNYYKRIQYRIGVTYSDGYLDIKNTKINNYAVTAGLGLPVGFGNIFQEMGTVNISAQYGKTGTISNNLLQEEYVRLILGFTFNNRWFVKYKYD